MRKILAVVGLTLGALVGVASAAQAGGPTSVLITQPATGAAAALYISSPAYDELERALSAEEGSVSAPSADAGGAAYHLTWLLHDVEPWRLDSVRITQDGEAYVATTYAGANGELARGEELRWQEVLQPKVLAAILDQVFGGAPVLSAPAPTVQEESAVPTAPQVAPAEPTTRWFSLTGWRWLVPGVLSGLLAGLVATRRRGPAEPRLVLVDRAPERARV